MGDIIGIHSLFHMVKWQFNVCSLIFRCMDKKTVGLPQTFQMFQGQDRHIYNQSEYSSMQMISMPII